MVNPPRGPIAGIIGGRRRQATDPAQLIPLGVKLVELIYQLHPRRVWQLGRCPIIAFGGNCDTSGHVAAVYGYAVLDEAVSLAACWPRAVRRRRTPPPI